MPTPSHTPDELLRLEELSRYSVVIEHPEEAYDELARLAVQFTGTALGGVSLVDDAHVWLKGRVGVDFNCIAREGAFCSWAVESNQDVFVVPDTIDDQRFVHNPLVAQAPHIRYYAAALLTGHRGYPIGTLWVMDTRPRQPSEDDLQAMQALAGQAMRYLELTYRNPHTRLPNRSTFVGQLQKVLNERSADAPGKPAVVVGFIHLHNLHLINSAYGREVGEQVLLMLAERLRDWAGAGHLLGHIEGDSFAFALLQHQTAFEARLDDLLSLLGTPLPVERALIRLNCSVGVSRFPEAGHNASSLLDQAAAAATLTHSMGAPAIKTFDAGHWEHTLLTLNLQVGHLVVHYQPQVDIVGGDVIGFEALARMDHPQLGLVFPERFVGLAERDGLIDQIDLQVLDIVCRDLRRWLDAGLPVLPVGVNLSRHTLLLATTVERLRAVLARHGVPARLIEIEVTESGLADSSATIPQRVEALHALGLKVAVDDFGNGVSNLAALRSLRFHRLKADRLYVHGASSNVHVGGLLRFIHNIAELFEVQLLCEGLEDETDLHWAAQLGCRYFQGWYFCAALPAEAATDLLQRLPAFRAGTLERGVAELSRFLNGRSTGG